MNVKIPNIICPHCKTNMGLATEQYLYGSPFRVCKKCKKTYVDARYHEIAVEGIRQEDIEPSEEQLKKKRRSGRATVWAGVGVFALFFLILAAGWIVYPLPVIAVICMINGSGKVRECSKKGLEKIRRNLEIEAAQSNQRMQDPQYVEQLRSVGYIN